MLIRHVLYLLYQSDLLLKWSLIMRLKKVLLLLCHCPLARDLVRFSSALIRFVQRFLEEFSKPVLVVVVNAVIGAHLLIFDAFDGSAVWRMILLCNQWEITTLWALGAGQLHRILHTVMSAVKA